MPESDMRKKYVAKKVYRGSQLIFGERQHLREVLRSVQSAKLPRARKQKEIRQLQTLIEARTGELNRINPGWDRKHRQALDPQTAPQDLFKLASTLPEGDFLLARALSENPNASGELLSLLAFHPYPATRENVARHPHTPVEVLRRLAEQPEEPLWFLVACNPATPADLREQLRAKMRPDAGIS